MKLFEKSTNCIILLVIAMCLVFAGCSKTYVTEFSPQSHFDYPNSNIIPLGKVRGAATKSAFLMPALPDSALKKEAILNALSQQTGSDILVNYMVLEKRTDFFGINSLTLIVEGTAAKSEIGKQKLQ
jgi:hypothetical protein